MLLKPSSGEFELICVGRPPTLLYNALNYYSLLSPIHSLLHLLIEIRDSSLKTQNSCHDSLARVCFWYAIAYWFIACALVNGLLYKLPD